jgi:hypothetical protein
MGGGALCDAGQWLSQAVVTKERDALVKATRFYLEFRVLIGLIAIGSGEQHASAAPSQNDRRWHRSAASAVNISWIIWRNTVPIDS